MAEYYPALRHLHIVLALLSVGLFVVLGSIALKRGRTHVLRATAFVAALLTVAFLFSVARAHHPLGIVAGALG